MKRSEANWIGHILRRNCLQKHITEGEVEGKIEVKGRQGRRLKHLLDGFKETKRYWKLKLQRTCFERGDEPIVRRINAS
jgi:hypothetical protein